MKVTQATNEDRSFFWDKEKLICSYTGMELTNVPLIFKMDGKEYLRIIMSSAQVIVKFLKGELEMRRANDR